MLSAGLEEKELKRNSCATLIKQIHNELEKNTNNMLRPQELTAAQADALMILSQSPEKQMSLKELERMLHVAQSTAAGIVNRLEQRGYIGGFSDEVDKRVKLLRITEKGESCCYSAGKNAAKAEEQLLEKLTETEREIFHSLLRKVWDTLL